MGADERPGGVQKRVKKEKQMGDQEGWGVQKEN